MVENKEPTIVYPAKVLDLCLRRPLAAEASHFARPMSNHILPHVGVAHTPPSSPSSGYSCTTSFQSSEFDEEKGVFRKEQKYLTRDFLYAIENDYQLLLRRSGKSLWTHIRLEVSAAYNVIFALVATANLIAIPAFLSSHSPKVRSDAAYGRAMSAAAANICGAVLMRNEHIVNLLFTIACSIPHSTPLWVRCQGAKVYNHGGFHSSCGIAGALWYALYLAMLTNDYRKGGLADQGLVIIGGLALFLLVTIIALAHPYIRRRFHDIFEFAHRFLGWMLLATFWVQTLLLSSAASRSTAQPLGKILVKDPSFWLLTTITLCVAYPWIRLRKREIEVSRLSDHAARIDFKYREMSTSTTVRLLNGPVRDTHAFATIPNHDNTKGFSILVSNAGNWTNDLINNPPKQLYVKGAPTFGVTRVSLLFEKVLLVATGSGIGPCLSILQSNRKSSFHILWMARSPARTYGQDVMTTVHRADPDAIIVDTRETGRGDVLALAYGLFRRSGAEVAIVISNHIVTKKVVRGLEAQGIPCFGPIFDS